MSMLGNYARFTPEELDKALEDPGWILDFVYSLEEKEVSEGIKAPQARCYDVDKAWHGLDFLLERIQFPINVVFGENDIPGADDTGHWSYGPPRYLTPEQVQTAAHAMADTPASALLDGVTLADLDEADIYPHVWTDNESLEYVAEYYQGLVDYFNAAAKDGHAILTWIA